MGSIAREVVYGQRPGEPRFAITIEIGTPYPYQDKSDEWACPFALTGVYDTCHDVHGSSALQVLGLAVALAYNLLRAFQDEGTLSYEDGSPYDLDATFGRSLIA